MTTVLPKSVAVIGAGAAGLVAARELRREGHEVVVFERGNKIGGTWVYNPTTESDPLGIDPARTVVHSSLYASLRTNLPREVMGFREYPFVAKNGAHRDPRRFPGHGEVLEYLNDYTTEFGLGELVRFGAEVTRVGLEGGKWKVRSTACGEPLDEVYDAVVVCNGHYTEPRIAEIPGNILIYVRPFPKFTIWVECKYHIGMDFSAPSRSEMINFRVQKSLSFEDMWCGFRVYERRYRFFKY